MFLKHRGKKSTTNYGGENFCIVGRINFFGVEYFTLEKIYLLSILERIFTKYLEIHLYLIPSLLALIIRQHQKMERKERIRRYSLNHPSFNHVSAWRSTFAPKYPPPWDKDSRRSDSFPSHKGPLFLRNRGEKGRGKYIPKQLSAFFLRRHFEGSFPASIQPRFPFPPWEMRFSNSVNRRIWFIGHHLLFFLILGFAQRRRTGLSLREFFSPRFLRGVLLPGFDFGR